MVERDEQHIGADRHPPGARRDRRERRSHGGEIAVVGEVMLRQPDRVEALLIGVVDLRHHRGVELPITDLRELGRIAEIEHVTELY